METVKDYFGSLVFNEDTMRERLPKDIYSVLRRTIDEGEELDLNLANAVAHAMKSWALEKGCTYYTHWFQPMTGITAEKHEAFIKPEKGGKVLLEFSGKELIKGEPDASSFPSGGLRATFEARGYTTWDPTSYAFIKEDTLCIPTAFCSYSGEVLDKKTPLLRSMEAVSKEARKILHLFGDDVKKVSTMVGAEQEYFLIPEELFNKREDPVLTGRTLLGKRSPKGQELHDHYFGALKTKVGEYMRDLDKELWKLGIASKTTHNEAAPAQHEMAPYFTSANIAVDHNQLAMEIMKKVALRHGFVCLLHEKPFKGVNGSGKHNNWSLSTDGGVNLFDMGETPKENARFLLFLAAVIKGVDEYQDLLRISIASAGNDHRLGSHEAPPAIVSIFIGSDLEMMLDALLEGKQVLGKLGSKMRFGVHTLPEIQRDSTDRNRTSPFAFTGNKFEFRMLGSSFSVSEPNVVLNTIVASSLSEFYEELKKAGEGDFRSKVIELVRETYKKHKRIIFNGNNYSESWVEEAKKRGLENLPGSPEAFDAFTREKNVKLFSRFGIYSPLEMESRQEILYENYSQTLRIEALTLVDMLSGKVLPAIESYTRELADALLEKKKALPKLSCRYEEDLLEDLSVKLDNLFSMEKELSESTGKGDGMGEKEMAHHYRDVVLPLMERIRKVADEAELEMPSSLWPYPSYSQMLQYV